MTAGDRTPDELVFAYEEAARSWGAATREGLPDAANARFDELVAIYRQLKRREPQGVAALLPLLADDDPGVVLAAASVLLELFPAKATAALHDISTRNDLIGFEAKMTLKEWEAGRMKLPEP